MTETKYLRQLESRRASSMVTTNTDYTSQGGELGSCFNAESTPEFQGNYRRIKEMQNIVKIKPSSYTYQNEFRPKSDLHTIINKHNFAKEYFLDTALYLHVHPNQETKRIDEKKIRSTDTIKTSVQYRDEHVYNSNDLLNKAHKGLAAFDGPHHEDNKVISEDSNIHSYTINKTAVSKRSRQTCFLEKERVSSTSEREDCPKSQTDISFVCNKSKMSSDSAARHTETPRLGNGDYCACDRNLDSCMCALNTKLSRKPISSFISSRIPLSQRKKLCSKYPKIIPLNTNKSSNVKKIYNCEQNLSDKIESEGSITIASSNRCTQDKSSEDICDVQIITHEEVQQNFDSEFELEDTCTDTQSNGTSTTKVSSEYHFNLLPQDIQVRSFYSDSMCNNTSDESHSECTSKTSLVASRTDHNCDQGVIPLCNSSLTQNQHVLSECPLHLTNVNSSILQIKKAQEENENIVICAQQSNNPQNSKIENHDEFDVKKTFRATNNSGTKIKSETLEVNEVVTRSDLKNNLTNRFEFDHLESSNENICVTVVHEGDLTEKLNPSMTSNSSLIRINQRPTENDLLKTTTLSSVLTDFALNNSHESKINTCEIVAHGQECNTRNNSGSIKHLMCNEESVQLEQSKQQPNCLSSTTSRVGRMHTVVESTKSTRGINTRRLHNDENVQAHRSGRHSRLLNRPRNTNLPQNGTTKYVHAKLTRLSNAATLQRDKTDKYSTVHCANNTRIQQTNDACKLPFAKISLQNTSERPAMSRLQKTTPFKKPLISRCFIKTMKQTDQKKKLQLLPQYKQIIKHNTTTASHIVKNLRKQKQDPLHCQAPSDLCTTDNVSKMEEAKNKNDLATNSSSCEHASYGDGTEMLLENAINDNVSVIPATIDFVPSLFSEAHIYSHSIKFHSEQDLEEKSRSAKSDKSRDIKSNPVSAMERKMTKTTPSFTATKGTLILKDVVHCQRRQRKLSAYYSQVIEMPSFSTLSTESVIPGSCSESDIPGGYTSIQQCLNSISATKKDGSVLYVQHSSVCDGKCEEAQNNGERCESQSSFLTSTSVRTSLNNHSEGNIYIKYCSSFVEHPQIIQTEYGNIGMSLNSELVGSGFEGDEQTDYSESKDSENISESNLSANISDRVPSTHTSALKCDSSNYADILQNNANEFPSMKSCPSIRADSDFKRVNANNDSLNIKQSSNSVEKLDSLTFGFKGHPSTERVEKFDLKVQSRVKANFKPNITPKKNRSCIADLARQKQFNTIYSRCRRRLTCGPIHVTDIHSDKSSRASVDSERTSSDGNPSLLALHNTRTGYELGCTGNDACGSSTNTSSFDQRKDSISFPLVSSKEVTCIRQIETLNKECTKLNYVGKASIETDTQINKDGIEAFANKRKLAESTIQLIQCCSRRSSGLIVINENTTELSLKMSDDEEIHKIERRNSPLIETTRNCKESINKREENEQNETISSLQNTEIIEVTENASMYSSNDLSTMSNPYILTNTENETSGRINSNYTQSSSKSSYSMNVTYNSTDNLSTASGKPHPQPHLGTRVSLNSSNISNTEELKDLLKSIVEKSISDCLLAVSKSMHVRNKKLSKTKRLDHRLFPCLKTSSASNERLALKNLLGKNSCDKTRVRMFHRNKEYCSKPNNVMYTSTDELGYIPGQDNRISENKAILKRKKKICRHKIKYKLEENNKIENVVLKNKSEDSNRIERHMKSNKCFEGPKKVVKTSKSLRRRSEKMDLISMGLNKIMSKPSHTYNKKSHHCTMLLSEGKSHRSNFHKSDIPFISNDHLRKLVQEHIYAIPQNGSKTGVPISESNTCPSFESGTIRSKRERDISNHRSLKTRMLRPKAKTSNPYGSLTHGKNVTEKNKHSHRILEKDLCIFGWTPEIASNRRAKELSHCPITMVVSQALLNCESKNINHIRREDKNLCERRSKIISNKNVDCVRTQSEENTEFESSRELRKLKRIIPKSEETIQHFESEKCKRNDKCVGGGRKETLWAITRINTFHDGSRTYEVMEPSIRRPRHIPETSHDIFVVAPSHNVARL